jgi:hypothetical protein
MSVKTIYTDRLVTCPCCGKRMHFMRTVPSNRGLPEMWKHSNAKPACAKCGVGERYRKLPFRHNTGFFSIHDGRPLNARHWDQRLFFV